MTSETATNEIENDKKEEKKTKRRESVVLTSLEKTEFVKKFAKKLDQIASLTEKLTEVETAYAEYKENTVTELLDLREKLDQQSKNQDGTFELQEKLNKELLERANL